MDEYKVGYARVSTGSQNTDSQIDALNAFGCIKVFYDKVSGIREDRPGWHRLIDYLREGDSGVSVAMEQKIGIRITNLAHQDFSKLLTVHWQHPPAM